MTKLDFSGVSPFDLSKYWIIVVEIINAEWRPRKCWLDLECILENSHFCKSDYIIVR